MDYLEEYPVDVVFTDINMPVVDGLKLLEYVSGKMPSAARGGMLVYRWRMVYQRLPGFYLCPESAAVRGEKLSGQAGG